MDFARGEKNVEDRGRILKERQTQSLRTVAETLNIARETAHMVSAQSGIMTHLPDYQRVPLIFFVILLHQKNLLIEVRE
jgi:hypothetical protein